MSDCHSCSCHLSPPCGQCVECGHWDTTCDGDCQTCDCIDRTPPPPPPAPEQIDRSRFVARWDRERELRDFYRYVAKPYSHFEWSYGSARYTIRPMTAENRERVVKELISNHTHFGHRFDGATLVIYVD